MTTFVLVHGAWHGGWCYDRVAERLRAHEHRVFTPTLAGLGDRQNEAHPQISLGAHVNDVVETLVFEDLHDVVLCGHSYGGMVISGAVERVPERIAALVYLDAFVPDDGQSLHDLVPEANRQRQIDGAAANGGFVPPVRAAHFQVNERDRDYVDANCVGQPLETMRERLRLTGARDRVRHRTYLRAGKYRSDPFDAARDRFRSDPAWFVDTISAGHDVMLDAPDALADALLAAARRAGA